jgi:hypothetical protein
LAHSLARADALRVSSFGRLRCAAIPTTLGASEVAMPADVVIGVLMYALAVLVLVGIDLLELP